MSSHLARWLAWNACCVCTCQRYGRWVYKVRIGWRKRIIASYSCNGIRWFHSGVAWIRSYNTMTWIFVVGRESQIKLSSLSSDVIIAANIKVWLVPQVMTNCEVKTWPLLYSFALICQIFKQLLFGAQFLVYARS